MTIRPCMTGGVIPALVAGIQASAIAIASGTMDPGDEHRDDNVEGSQ
jgi:hypothetical protein